MEVASTVTVSYTVADTVRGGHSGSAELSATRCSGRVMLTCGSLPKANRIAKDAKANRIHVKAKYCVICLPPEFFFSAKVRVR